MLTDNQELFDLVPDKFVSIRLMHIVILDSQYHLV